MQEACSKPEGLITVNLEGESKVPVTSETELFVTLANDYKQLVHVTWRYI